MTSKKRRYILFIKLLYKEIVKKFIFLLPFIFFLIIALLTISDYGINWDESVHFGRGQAILHYFLTGKKDYSDLQANSTRRLSYYQNNAYTLKFFDKKFEEGGSFIIGGGHPPLSDIFASIFNTVFYQNLHILGDIESYHFYSIFLASLLIAVIFYFTSKTYNALAGMIAAIALATYPLFLGESHYNIKDVPETVFISFAILSFYKGVISNSIRWIFLSSLVTAFAFGTKFNVVFLPFIILPWMMIYYLPEIKKSAFGKFLKKRSRIVLLLLFYPIISLSIFFLSWPLLWHNTIERFMTVINYYKSIGINPNFDPRFFTIFNLNTYAIQWLLYTTPIVILIFSLSGILYALKCGFREQNKATILILLWFIVPITRVTMPNASIYGGLRQIMEYIPAMAILAGIGASYMVRLLHGYMVKNLKLFSHLTIKPFQLLVVLSFLPITLKLISIHPNENVYFNPIIGGLKGAKEKELPGWGNSLGSTYRQGTKWLNKHAEKNAKLVLVYELRSNIPESDLRPDIQYNNQLRSGIKREGEYAIGVTHDGTQENLYYRKYLERFLNPIWELKVDGVSVLKIWKNELAHTKSSYAKEEKKSSDLIVEKKEETILIDLKKIMKITKIEINYDSSSCMLPSNGYFEISKNGVLWERQEGDFSFFYFAGWFKTQPKEGVLAFLFAGDEVRYIKLVVNDENSCLLLKPLAVDVWHI